MANMMAGAEAREHADSSQRSRAENAAIKTGEPAVRSNCSRLQLIWTGTGDQAIAVRS